jgi:hypothetical protein
MKPSVFGKFCGFKCGYFSFAYWCCFFNKDIEYDEEKNQFTRCDKCLADFPVEEKKSGNLWSILHDVCRFSPQTKSSLCNEENNYYSLCKEKYCPLAANPEK